VTQLICLTGTSAAKEPAVSTRVSKEAAASIFRVEETGFSTMLVPVYKSTRRRVPEGHKFEEDRSYVLLLQQIAQYEFRHFRM
jgi:hypothetical protein